MTNITTEDLNISYRNLRKTAQNSTSIVLPFFMIDTLGWQCRDTIKVTRKDDKLILEKVELVVGNKA